MMFGLEFALHADGTAVRQCGMAPFEDGDGAATRVLQFERCVVVASVRGGFLQVGNIAPQRDVPVIKTRRAGDNRMDGGLGCVGSTPREQDQKGGAGKQLGLVAQHRLVPLIRSRAPCPSPIAEELCDIDLYDLLQNSATGRAAAEVTDFGSGWAHWRRGAAFVEATGKPEWSPASRWNSLLLLVAFRVRRLGTLICVLRVLLGLRRVLLALDVVIPAMRFSRSAMGLRGKFMMFRCSVVFVLH